MFVSVLPVSGSTLRAFGVLQCWVLCSGRYCIVRFWLCARGVLCVAVFLASSSMLGAFCVLLYF